MMRGKWALVMGPMVASTLSCTPKIKRLSVTPQAYCASTSKIVAEWDTKNGTTSFEISSPGENGAASTSLVKLLDVPEGKLELAPRPMDLKLVVVKGSRREERPIRVRPVLELKSLDSRGDQCAGRWVTSVPFTYGGGSAAFDPNARLATISNTCTAGAAAGATCRRNVEVIHGSQRWAIAPGATVEVSGANATLGGEWTLRQELLPGEECQTPSAEPAVNFALAISTMCTRTP